MHADHSLPAEPCPAWGSSSAMTPHKRQDRAGGEAKRRGSSLSLQRSQVGTHKGRPPQGKGRVKGSAGTAESGLPAQPGTRPAARPVSSPPTCFPRVLKMEEFFPETYRLDIRDEREAFFALFDGERTLDSRPATGRQVRGGTERGRGQGRRVEPG